MERILNTVGVSLGKLVTILNFNKQKEAKDSNIN